MALDKGWDRASDIGQDRTQKQAGSVPLNSNAARTVPERPAHPAAGSTLQPDEPELCYSSVSDVVYCANGRGNLSVVSADGTRVLHVVPVGEGPQSFALAPRYDRLFVGHGGETNMVYVVRDEVGIAESGISASAKAEAATLARTQHDAPAAGMLADIAGRPVACLAPGLNDLSDLPPGVYIAVTPGQSRPRKVVILK